MKWTEILGQADFKAIAIVTFRCYVFYNNKIFRRRPIQMSSQGWSIRRWQTVRQVLRVCGRCCNHQTLPRRPCVRPYHQEDQQMWPTLQCRLRRQDRTSLVFSLKLSKNQLHRSFMTHFAQHYVERFVSEGHLTQPCQKWKCPVHLWPGGLHLDDFLGQLESWLSFNIYTVWLAILLPVTKR